MGSIGGKRRVVAALACAGIAALAVTAAPSAASAATALPDAGGLKPGHGPAHFTLPADAPKPDGAYRIQSAYKVLPGGTQTYSCDAATGQWGTASIPEAQLARYGGPGRIHHYRDPSLTPAGPRWTARDGGTLVGTVVADKTVAKAGTIPWLLLSVVHENDGPRKELHSVDFISRVNTTGGAGPTGACTAGETKSVPYGADYVFWTKKK